MVRVMQSTPTQKLADALLPIPLAQYVADKRQGRPKWRWQDIADQLREDTEGKVDISREALRKWFPDLDATEQVA